MQGPFAVLSRLRLLSLTKRLHGHEATANRRYYAACRKHVHMPETETLIKFFSQGGSKCSQNGDRCERAEGVMAQDQPCQSRKLKKWNAGSS